MVNIEDLMLLVLLKIDFDEHKCAWRDLHITAMFHSS